MKTNLLVTAGVISFLWFCYSGFTSGDDDPRWFQDPRTAIGLSPEGEYLELPQPEFFLNPSNETRYIVTPQGTFSVGPNFRVHPRSVGTQSETPITRSPVNPNLMFASANTFQGGVFSTGVFVTTDGGVTWTGNDTLGATILNSGDPGPVVDYTGRLLISYITSAFGMGASFSTNNGATFSSTFTFGSSANSPDKNLSVSDMTPGSSFYGRTYTVWTEFAGTYTNRIVSSFTTDGGVSWSARIPVSPAPSSGHHHQGCDVTVDIYGIVRVVWANCTTNGQNSTEDSLGWAESGSGGTSWTDVSNHKVNMNGIRTTDLLTPSNVAIRANGFPRIDGDRTCNPTADDEYVVAAEKNFAPALDNADIVLMKTTDGGSTWTRTRVNQNAAGSYEYSPAVHVDETGAVNVCYYSTRNVPTNDSAQIYLSRSTNGGVTFTDVLISDHKFKPVPISGTASGYQGDYIGITSGGAGKILPYWCEQNASTGGRYQAYTSLVDISVPAPCEDFSCNKDTGTATTALVTRNFFEEYSGTNYWGRKITASAYGSGTGSARFNSWSAATGTTQSLSSYQFPASASGTYLTFDRAYAPWSGGNIDSLIVETSSNAGAVYHVLAKLWGGLGAQAGPLNTVFVGGGEFTPTANQWAPFTFSLPFGTNKVRLRAVSGFGNDIWVDNVCVQTLASAVSNSIGLIHQGMFIPTDPYWRLLDTVKVVLHRVDFPNIKVDSAVSIVGGNAVINNLFFNRALNGTYYRVVEHRNCIETWSNVGVVYTRGSSSTHNFVPNGSAYGNNEATVSTSPFYKGIYTGDVTRDNSVDISDLSQIENAAFNFTSGYVVWDLTGDNFVDLTDLSIADNNSFNFVQTVAPPGAEPSPAPSFEYDSKNITFESDADRQKYELTKELMKQQELKSIAENNEKENLKKDMLEKMKKRMNIKDEDRAPTILNLEKLNREEINSTVNSGRQPGDL